MLGLFRRIEMTLAEEGRRPPVSDKPHSRSHNRAFYTVLLVAIFSLWKLFHQDDTHRWELPAEPWPQDPPKVTPAPEADPLAELAGALQNERVNGLSRELTAFEHRYAVKWTDRSEGEGVPVEKRDLTLKEATPKAGWISQHARRFYSGADTARSPFDELRVYLQCLCGRDVTDLIRPHTIPGGNAPASTRARRPPSSVGQPRH